MSDINELLTREFLTENFNMKETSVTSGKIGQLVDTYKYAIDIHDLETIGTIGLDDMPKGELTKEQIISWFDKRLKHNRIYKITIGWEYQYFSEYKPTKRKEYYKETCSRLAKIFKDKIKQFNKEDQEYKTYLELKEKFEKTNIQS